MSFSSLSPLHGGRACLCAFAAVALTFLPLFDAQSYPKEPDGFEGLAWGTAPAQLLSKRPGLRKKGYTLGKMRRGLKRSPGGIFVVEVAACEGFEEAELRYHVSKAGLFRVVARLVDSSPSRYAAARELVAKLTERHGPPSETEPKVWLWVGERTVLRLEESMAISGVDLTLTLTRRAEHDSEAE